MTPGAVVVRACETARLVARVGALVVATACLVVTSAHAQWSLDAGVERFDWREHTSPIEVHENGPRFTLGAGFTQPKERGPLLACRGRLYGGEVDYNGSFQFDATQAASGASTYLGTTLAPELRYRWPGAADAVLGVDVDLWKRRLSSTQREDYRVVSMRLGVEHVAGGSSPLSGGAGMRFLLAASEDATVEEGGFRYDLTLSPGLGSNPYVHAGFRVMPNVTLLADWDGMNLGRSNEVVLLKRGRPRAVVSQPETDVSRIGLRVAYGW